MSSIDDADHICPEGLFIYVGNAVNIQGLEGGGDSVNGNAASKKAFKQRATLDESIHVEHGRDS